MTSGFCLPLRIHGLALAAALAGAFLDLNPGAALGAEAGPADGPRFLAPSAISIDAMREQVEASRDLAGQRLGGLRGADLPLGGTNEPTVVVNPLDPMNIVYASLFELRISTDGGSSFGAAVLPPLPPTHVRCGDVSLDFDSQGRLFWTYIGCPQPIVGYDLFVVQLDPRTGAILPGYPVNITKSPTVNMPASGGYYNDKEWLAADGHAASPFADRLYVTWSQYRSGLVNWRVLTTASADQGQTWGAARELSAPNGAEGFAWPSHNTARGRRGRRRGQPGG